MKKGLGPIAIALIAVAAILVGEAIFLQNFIIRIESAVRTINEGNVIEGINEMEFAKKALYQSISHSFYQASHFVSILGGYPDIDNVVAYNCTPYWRNFTTTNYPNNFKAVIEDQLIKTYIGYAGSLDDPVEIPDYTTATIDENIIKVEVRAAGDLRNIEDYRIYEKSTFSKRFDINSIRVFNLSKIGKERFIDTDSVLSAITTALASHSCGDSQSTVSSDISTQISNLQTNLNNQYAPVSINFNLKADGFQFDPTCNSRVGVRVMVSIRDSANNYVVYDTRANVTKLANIQLNFYILSGNYVIQPIIAPCNIECSGIAALSLSPPTAVINTPVIPKVSGLLMCPTKSVSFRLNNCTGTEVSSCNINIEGRGCTGNAFNAPSVAGSYTYYACIDKNSDNDYWETGEAGSSGLTVIPPCSGDVRIALSPTSVLTSDSVSASASGLSWCDGKNVSIRRNSCLGAYQCSCPASGTGCSCTFTAPSSSGSYTYYACIDKNTDADYLDTGEFNSTALTVRPLCTGSISLSYSPNPVLESRDVSAISSDLSCEKETKVYIRETSCSGTEKCNCDIAASGTGCSCTFTAPPSATIQDFTYYACIDKNNDGDFSDTGESTSSPLTVTPVCAGNIDLSLYPDPSDVSDSVSASASGLSYCDGKIVHVKQGSCSSGDQCSCTVSGAGCSCSFTAPSTPGSVTHYACIDKSEPANGNFDDTGEQDTDSLEVCKTLPSVYDRDVWTDYDAYILGYWFGQSASPTRSLQKKSGYYSVYGGDYAATLTFSYFALYWDNITLSDWDILHFWFKSIDTGALSVYFIAQDGLPHFACDAVDPYSTANTWIELKIDLSSCRGWIRPEEPIQEIQFYQSTTRGPFGANIDDLYLAKDPGCSSTPAYTGQYWCDAASYTCPCGWVVGCPNCGSTASAGSKCINSGEAEPTACVDCGWSVNPGCGTQCVTSYCYINPAKC